MIKYTNEQLATVIALPTITILLVWTVAIFQKNRKKWGPYDIPIVLVLVLSIIRNVTILVYLLVSTLSEKESFRVDYCSFVVWIFNCIHTFQASSLTTIAVIGLFSVKLHRKQQNLRLFLTPTHIIYHLFCLTTLCACVGVAAILAQNENDVVFENIVTVFEINFCKFMPFELDIKFNVFIIVLHVFLAVISLISFLIICYNFYQVKKQGFDYLKKSNSDLSDMSLGLTNTLNVKVAENNNKNNFYDTYTIHRGHSNTENNNYYDPNQSQNQNPHYQNGFCATRDVNWNSDLSNISTTVSSTNSRRPCLGNNLQDRDESNQRTGLATMHPVLIVCYLFYHLPLIVLCLYPKLIYPWPVTTVALWLGLIQDFLIPLGLGIVDTRFCKWVKSVYKCSGKSVEEKLPHVGLDGKFRTFGNTSQPHSLDISNQDRNVRALHTVEHRFPITNGSLYTSIDGRLPVIHNYRRHKDQRGGLKQPEKQSSNVALHSSHLNRHEKSKKFSSCTNCEADLCPSHSNLHHLSPQYINKKLSLIQQNNSVLVGNKMLPNRVSHSQESLNYLPEQNRHFFRNSDLNLNVNNHIMKNSRNLVRLNKMRLSRSEDSLNDLQIRNMGKIDINPLQNPNLAQQEVQMKRFVKAPQPKPQPSIQAGYCSSDDDYLTDVNANANDTFDSMSSRSCYSITTEANCDFEFFQNNDRSSNDIPLISAHNTRNDNEEFYMMNGLPMISAFSPSDFKQMNSLNDLDKNFRIRRSNSKRSLENFQAFIEVENISLQQSNVNVINNNKVTLHRSNSYNTLEDRQKKGTTKLLRSDSKLSECQFNNVRQKIKSVEYLPSSNASTIFVEDLNEYNRYYGGRNDGNNTKYVGSVPDLKKIFISEYI